MNFNIVALLLILILGISSLGYTAEQGVQMKKQNIIKEIEMSNNWKWITGISIDELKVYSLPSLRKGKLIHKISGWFISMAVSENQNKIAFTVSPESISTEELFVIDSDGTNLVKLGEFDLGVVTFTPDNKSLIVEKSVAEDEYNRDISVDFFKLDIATKKKSFLCSLKHVSDYTGQLLSPDGLKLLYVDSSKNIIMYDIDRQKMVDMGIQGYSPAWSPDGRYIAYQGEDKNCYIMNPDGREKELLWDTRGYKGEIDLAWSPDSQYILAQRMEGGPVRWITAQKDAKELVYYVISRDSKIIKGLGALR